MHYTNVINSELKIAGVHLADLPEEYKEAAVRLWDDGSTADALTILYDRSADYIAINLDRPGSAILIELVETYLQADKKSREIFRKQATRFTEECKLLDSCLLYREIVDLLQISGKIMPGGLDLNERIRLFTEIRKAYRDEFIRLNTAYCCGYIQGVRQERARKAGRM